MARAGSLKALLFDKMEFPIFAGQFREDGTLEVEPQVFFFVRDFKQIRGQFPVLTVAFNYEQMVRLVKATLSSLPVLPEGQPESAGPDQFRSGQILDLTVQGEPEDTTDLKATLENLGASKIGPPPEGLQGQQPPPQGQQPPPR